MAIKKRNLVLCAACLVMFPSTYLQCQAKDRIAVTFRALQLGTHSTQELHFQNRNGPVENLQLNRIRKSAAYAYAGEHPIEFFRPEFDVTTQTIKKIPLVRVHIPDGCASPLIFFEKLSVETQRIQSYNTYIIDDSLEHFPNQSLIVLNTTARDIHGKLGDTQLALNNGPSTPIDVSKHVGASTRLQLAIATDDGPRMVFTNSFAFRANERYIIVITPPKRPGSIQAGVYTIRERVRDTPHAISLR